VMLRVKYHFTGFEYNIFDTCLDESWFFVHKAMELQVIPSFSFVSGLVASRLLWEKDTCG